MSFFTDLFESNSDTSKDIPNGDQLLQTYFDNAVIYGMIPFSDYGSFLADCEKKVPGYRELLGSLVRSNIASTTMDEAVARVKDLAVKSQGKATLTQITSAAGGKGDTVNWSEAIPQAAVGVADQALTAAVDLGENLSVGLGGTVKLLKYLPYILVAAGALYVYSSAPKIRINKNPRRKKRGGR